MAATVLSLFAGYGGLDLGLHAALGGGRTVGYVEREGYAARILLDRMEDETLEPAPVWADDIAGFPTAPFYGVDWIIGGFPCQPFSAAGSRKGIDDGRWLWDDIHRVIHEAGPLWVFLENTPGVNSGPAYGVLCIHCRVNTKPRPCFSVEPGRVGSHCDVCGRSVEGRRTFLVLSNAIAAVLGSLSDLGFDAEWDLFAAEDVGASHRRRRWFCVARRRDGVDDPFGRRRAPLTERSVRPGRDGAVAAGDAVADADLAGFDRGGRPERSEQQGEPGDESDGCSGVGRAQRGADGRELGAAASGGCGVERGAEGEGGGRHTDGADPALADTAEQRRQGHGKGGILAVRAEHDGCSEVLADDRRELLERGHGGPAGGLNREGAGGPGRPAIRRLFAPGPADVRGWARIMAVRPDLAPALPHQGSEAQSAFRERTHGSAVLVDGGEVDGDLPVVRKRDDPKAVLKRRSGEPFDARPSQILQSPVHGRWHEEVTRRLDAIWSLGEGTPAFEASLRALREFGEAYDPPYRQRLEEQLAREPDHVMSVLSHHAPPQGGRDRAEETPALLSRLRRIVRAEGFQGTDLLTALWVDYAKAAERAMTYRQHRLRALGNGVVPLQAAVAVLVLADRAGWDLTEVWDRMNHG